MRRSRSRAAIRAGLETEAFGHAETRLGPDLAGVRRSASRRACLPTLAPSLAMRGSVKRCAPLLALTACGLIEAEQLRPIEFRLQRCRDFSHGRQPPCCYAELRYWSGPGGSSTTPERSGGTALSACPACPGYRNIAQLGSPSSCGRFSFHPYSKSARGPQKRDRFFGNRRTSLHAERRRGRRRRDPDPDRQLRRAVRLDPSAACDLCLHRSGQAAGLAGAAGRKILPRPARPGRPRAERPCPATEPLRPASATGAVRSQPVQCLSCRRRRHPGALAGLPAQRGRPRAAAQRSAAHLGRGAARSRSRPRCRACR